VPGKVLNMLKRMHILPLPHPMLLVFLCLGGCVTHYHVPPQTVVYRDVHGLTSGVYDNQAEPVYSGLSTSYGSSAWYPSWSLDSMYVGYGHGYGYGYGHGYGYGYRPYGPSFSISWSSGYPYPGPWYGYNYDPWYCPPFRYGWYAPYSYGRYHDYYAWNQPYWRGRHGRYYGSGYRDPDQWGGQGRSNNTATLNPDWQRSEDQRRTWRDTGGDTRVPRSAPAPGDPDRQALNRRGVDRVAMPSATTGAQRGMTVRNRPDAKREVTRAHQAKPGVREVVDAAQGDEPRTVRYISSSAAGPSSAPAQSVRHKEQSKPQPMRGRPVADFKAPVVRAPSAINRPTEFARPQGVMPSSPGSAGMVGRPVVQAAPARQSAPAAQSRSSQKGAEGSGREGRHASEQQR